ncbi:acyltransferase [Tistrella mobilis]|uniref:acyltransferase family protein n=1 Tax=Tistrella mobilis TaxID=171437 RepID=UPI000789497B|nr:acyltransferase [Tistrella mobilis]
MTSLPTIFHVQYLRIAAAMMVVLLHASHSYAVHLQGRGLPVFLDGQKGVDLFFVISGFIMTCMTAREGARPGDFFLRRLTRVAPPYWIVTAAVLALAILAPSIFHTMGLDAAHVAASFAFLPWTHPERGTALPLFQLGWSLNLELEFYLLFALVLAVLPARRVAAMVTIVAGLVAAGLIFRPGVAAFRVWTSPILFDFVLGMVVAVAFLGRMRLSRPAGLILLTAGSVALFMTPAPQTTYDLWRWLTAGVPAAVILLAAVILEKGGHVRRIGWLRLLGDASYALYLCHYFAIGAVRAIWPSSAAGGSIGGALFLAAAAGLSIIGSVLFRRLVEKPVVDTVRRVVVRK